MALIVCPASRDDNNGNWRTAERWARLIDPDWASAVVSIRDCLADPAIMARADVLVALHAKRSAAAIDAWCAARDSPVVVVMTGTDLYRDILIDTHAQGSLAVAARLVVLQPLGLAQLPERWRDKARSIMQSTALRRPARRAARHLRVLMVGHLRPEKSPETWFDAVGSLAGDRRFRFDHIGAEFDVALGDEARALQRAVPNFRYLGGRPYPEVRRRMQSAHLLVHCSRLEGGAHVIMEAVCSGMAVLASRIDGNQDNSDTGSNERSRRDGYCCQPGSPWREHHRH